MGDGMRPRLIDPSADTIFCGFVENHEFEVDGPMKDTAVALPMRELTVDWTVDNPGSWAITATTSITTRPG